MESPLNHRPDDLRVHDPRLAAEACRPGTDDAARLLADESFAPAEGREEDRLRLAAHVQRLEAFDVAVGTAYRRVEVPAGLAERLTAALAADAFRSDAVGGNTLRPADVESPREVLPASSPLWSRRRWLTFGGTSLAATAAGVAFALWLNARRNRDLTLDDVLQQALVFHQSRAFRGLASQTSLETPPPAEFPLSEHLASALPATRWTSLDGRLLGRPGVAYDLAPGGGPRAALFVVQAGKLGAPNVHSLPSVPAQTPAATGGFTSAAWREADRICILLVEGDERRYRQFLRHGGGVFA